MQRGCGGKTKAAVEFGRQVVFDEVEGGIVTRLHVLADDESEVPQALPALEHHRGVVGHPPSLVTRDRRLHAQRLEAAARRPGGWGCAMWRSPGPAT